MSAHSEGYIKDNVIDKSYDDLERLSHTIKFQSDFKHINAGQEWIYESIINIAKYALCLKEMIHETVNGISSEMENKLDKLEIPLKFLINNLK